MLHLESVAPSGLIPLARQDIVTPSNRIPEAQAHPVGREHPPTMRSIDPFPAWPQDRNERRFPCPGRHVDDEFFDSPFRHGLEMIADCSDVRAITERGRGLDQGPRGLGEAPEVLLHPDLLDRREQAR